MKRVFFSLLSAGLLCGPIALGQEEFPWLSERKILGENNLEAIELAQGSLAYDFSRPVARVEVRAGGSGFCTGSRVGHRLFLTNFHCDMDCANMQFTMGYEQGIAAEDRTVFNCKELIRKNETLDYALFAVDVPKGLRPEVQYPILTLYKGPVVAGMKLLVPSHPSARLKEIDRSDECVLLSADIIHTESGRDTMTHMCDTEGGSSGSPVLDRERGYAIGLHWGGRPNEANYAISMRMIVEDLEATIPAKTFRQLHVAE